VIRRFELPRLRDASPAALAGLEADLAFCHPAITGLASVDAAAGALELTVAPGTDGDELDDIARQLAIVVDLSIRSYRFVEPTPPLWRHDAAARLAGPDALAAFVARYTRTLGPGQIALIGPAAELRSRLDRALTGLAAETRAEPWHLPSIEQTTDLIRDTGYLVSHGQYVTFGYHLPAHFEQIRRFTEGARERKLRAPDDPRDLTPAGFILEPFVCHNVYRALRGERLHSGRSITALGTCYRHEGFRFQPLTRQWEFSMREVVLAGSADYVAAQRSRLITATQRLCVDLDLDAALEIATDPFFVSEAASARTFQMMNSTKLELRLGLGGGRETAAASFNLHGKHFTEPMDIRDGHAHDHAETSCIAWGLERWMAAFVSRHGGNPERWPELK